MGTDGGAIAAPAAAAGASAIAAGAASAAHAVAISAPAVPDVVSPAAAAAAGPATASAAAETSHAAPAAGSTSNQGLCRRTAAGGRLCARSSSAALMNCTCKRVASEALAGLLGDVKKSVHPAAGAQGTAWAGVVRTASLLMTGMLFLMGLRSPVPRIGRSFIGKLLNRRRQLRAWHEQMSTIDHVQ